MKCEIMKHLNLFITTAKSPSQNTLRKCCDATVIRPCVRFVSHAEMSLAKVGGGQARLCHGGKIILTTEVIKTINRSRSRLKVFSFEQSHFEKPTLQTRQTAYHLLACVPFRYLSCVQIFCFHFFRDIS